MENTGSSTPDRIKSKLTEQMNIKKFIEGNVPAEVIAGAYKKCFTPHLNRTGQYASHTFLKHYLQQHWTGPAAIAAVEKATGKPNSITVQYRYDRKGRHPINEGVIGTRSLSYFCRDWFAPYLFDHYKPEPPRKSKWVVKDDTPHLSLAEIIALNIYQ